ncbi:MAG: hypothetical protein IT379_24315 [Deltaproteobacteria bacterium]|nr:hypothetical protein [Deltaproteobacteria bacterium]
MAGKKTKSGGDQGSMEKLLGAVKDTVVRSLVVHDDDLERREARAMDIRVISPHLTLDRGNFHDTIVANIERGARYRYLIPDELAVIGAMQRLAAELNAAAKPGRKSPAVEWRVVPAACVCFDMVVYDAHTANEEAYLVLPEDSFTFNLRLQGAFQDRVLGLFTDLWNNSDRLE